MCLKKYWLSLLIPVSLLSAITEDEIKGLYNGLDPSSISEHLALHKLYPHDPSGKKALKHVETLLEKARSEEQSLNQLPISTLSLDGFISFMLGKKIEGDLLEEQHLEAIESVSSHLKNRSLKGYQARSEEEIKKLNSEEIDFARALLIAQQRSTQKEVDWHWIRNYEAQLDFMALQVLASLPKDPSPREIIKEMNRLIFFKLRYRFPALSTLKSGEEPSSKLTTVLDSNQGVCLGISVLYLSLAQRLNLPLEIVIPPGHIYVRYIDERGEVNIETTARGINYPSENYLDVNTKILKQANIKEVIGFVFYNISSTYLVKTKEYSKAIENYLHCLEYAPTNRDAIELLGYSYLLNKQEKEAKNCFKKLLQSESNDRISSTFFDMWKDYLNLKIRPDAIEAIIEHADEDSRLDLEAKKKKFQKLLKKYPDFKAGLFYLSTSCQLLSETDQAIKLLEKLHALDPHHPYVELTLSSLYLQEYNFPKAWNHYRKLEAILNQHNHQPKIMKDLKATLQQYSIEP